MSYDDANSVVRREVSVEVGGAATTEYAKFRSFQAAKLKKVHAVVNTAGTNAGHGLGLYHGTTSIASLSLGTATAGSVVASATLDRALAAYDQISVKTLVDATGKAQVIYEYEVVPEAVKTT